MKFKVLPGYVDISEAEWELCCQADRVGGQALCPLCGRPYDDHLRVMYKGETIPTVHIDCTGRHVKT